MFLGGFLVGCVGRDVAVLKDAHSVLILSRPVSLLRIKSHLKKGTRTDIGRQRMDVK